MSTFPARLTVPLFWELRQGSLPQAVPLTKEDVKMDLAVQEKHEI